MESGGKTVDGAINKETDIKLDFDKAYSRYIRFDGRYNDENCDFDEVVAVMIPARPDTTNILMFQLVLLESE